MSNNERATKSATDYIDQLFENHSKLQVLRLDLYHKKTEEGPRELKELKQDVAHLISNSRSNKSLFGHMKGKIIKYENGDGRGPHAHTILFFDGQKLQKDAHLGDEIGKYWSENITKGNGTYHNVNRNKEKFERVGIGMIDQACGFHAIRPPSPLSSGQAFHGHLATCSTAIRPGSRSAATQGWHC